MSRRSKLEKFADLFSFSNVYENFDVRDPLLLGENGKPCKMRGLWNSNHFHNTQPIVLELACGRGEYTVNLARRYADKNFIGVDIKGARIWKGAKIALEESLENAAFLRTRIESITHFFEEGEVSEIWITFPDPFLRNSKINRRLTSPNFISIYRKFLVKKGIVHLKTDSPELYAFTLETLEEDPLCNIIYQNPDIYSKPLDTEELDIKTWYELSHLADERQIKYIRFTIN